MLFDPIYGCRFIVVSQASHTMFHDSDIVNKVKLGRDKLGIGYTITYRFAPFAHNRLLAKSKAFRILIDELMNKREQYWSKRICSSDFFDDEDNRLK